MLVGVAFHPPSFPPAGTYKFYIIKRQNCVYLCNRVYLDFASGILYRVIHANIHLGTQWDEIIHGGAFSISRDYL